MRHFRAMTLGLALTAAVSACASGEDGGEDMAEADPAASLSCYIQRGTPDEALERPSPLTETRFTYPSGAGLLCYGAPSARERTVMGGLVPYDAPWRMGANEPTTFHLSSPAMIGGVTVNAGSYSMYAVPGQQEWRVVINAAFERWGIPISAEVRASDVGSFMVMPEPIDEFVETLRYRWEPGRMGGGHIVFEWENTALRIPVEGISG